jgi:hypothetical protein
LMIAVSAELILRHLRQLVTGSDPLLDGEVNQRSDAC